MTPMTESTTSFAFELAWHDEVGAGYTDVLPLKYFEEQVESVDAVHDVRGPKGKISQAFFRLTVTAVEARLDYDAPDIRPANEKNGMALGTMALTFSDSSRTSILSVAWDGKEQRKEDVTVDLVPLVPQTDDEATSTDLAYAPRPVRPAQQAFRSLLLRVYGETCCISSCKVTSVLEAAHITAFAVNPKHANHARNGLLLRADLHSLFDLLLLGIEPTTLLVHVAPAAALWPEYGALNGKATLAKPKPGFEWAAPEKSRLEARWKQFIATGDAVCLDLQFPLHGDVEHS